MAICSNCGAELKPGKKFCTNCGTAVSGQASEMAETTDAKIQTRQSAPQTVPDGFVWIPGGTFIMGSTESEPGRSDNECPQHQVTVSGFYMGKYQVTQAQYKAVTGRSSPVFFRSAAGEMSLGEGASVEFPVIFVNWYNAINYCNERSRKEGLIPAYTIKDKNEPDSFNENVTVKWNKKANGYRLPTEAEWEYACRAGTTTVYNTGDMISNNTGWYEDNSGGKTHQVGLKPANAWGLYDMHGNVFEWCWDLYGDYPSGAQNNPTGASSGDKRILRGGSYRSNSVNLRSAYRSCYYARMERIGAIEDVGFRLVRP